MFSKPTKPEPAPQPRPTAPTPPQAASAEPSAPRKPAKVASLISAEMSIEGIVSGEGELQVDGVIRGDVRVGRLTIGETGHVEGSIFAEAAEVRGRVVGALTAKQVRLYGTAYVDGDITHDQLAMESGAFFQGRSLKLQRQSPAQPAGAPAPQAALSGPKPAEPPAEGPRQAVG